MANPASSHPAVNTVRLGALAMMTKLTVPTTEPTVMTVRGPRASRMRPMRMPATADISKAAENAAVVAVALQPVAMVICGLRTGKA